MDHWLTGGNDNILDTLRSLSKRSETSVTPAHSSKGGLALRTVPLNCPISSHSSLLPHGKINTCLEEG